MSAFSFSRLVSLPMGQAYHYISKFSAYKKEQEVLLIPGFRFKVIEVRDDGASAHVILKEHQIKSHA